MLKKDFQFYYWVCKNTYSNYRISVNLPYQPVFILVLIQIGEKWNYSHCGQNPLWTKSIVDKIPLWTTVHCGNVNFNVGRCGQIAFYAGRCG